MGRISLYHGAACGSAYGAVLAVLGMLTMWPCGYVSYGFQEFMLVNIIYMCVLLGIQTRLLKPKPSRLKLKPVIAMR
jgi:hypothetical protein